MQNGRLLLLTLPSRRRRMRNRELIKNAKDQMIDEGFDCLRTMIETRARRQDLRSGARQLQKILEMNRIVWRLSRYQYQLPALLERYVRGAMN